MRTVSFIHTESKDDLIVSFALCVADDPTDVESLTLLRTPKYEVFLEERERGVKVSFELEEKGLLKEVAFHRDSATVHVRTSECSFELDLRSVERVEIKDTLRVLKLMNFDGRLEISELQ
ncbi:MAG TPA: hypothetical protein VLG74_01450 [Blastocatellia bacterium]|nr:hypothetical protein [Blastocatellia bacterium]